MINLEDAERRLRAARQDFLRINDAYEALKPDRLAVKAHADRFINDTDPNRSIVIREHAQRVKTALDQFRRDEQALVSEIALALTAMQGRAYGYALSSMQQLFDRAKFDLDAIAMRISTRIGRPVERNLLEPANLIELKGARDLGMMAKGIEVATLVLEFHNNELRSFLENHVERDHKVYLKAIKKIFSEDVTEKILSASWEIFNELAPELAAIVAPATRFANVLDRLQEKILELHVPYRPAGPEDAILNLPIRLEKLVAACKLSREAIRSM